ncbi:MAG: rod shape-determining protein MreC [Lachnospiraceae bacterium]
MRNGRKKKSKKIVISTRAAIVIAAVVILFFYILTKNYQKSLSPMQNVIQTVLYPAEKLVNHFGKTLQGEEYRPSEEVLRENEALHSQIRELKKENKKLKKQEVENQRLHKLLDMADSFKDYELVGARVVSNGESNWFSSFLIDKGYAQGMKKNMNVVTNEGLVGYIASVSKNYSKVVTIIDNRTKVSGMSMKGSDYCTVKGNQEQITEGTIPIKDIDSNAFIEVGETIVTSNISSKYLPGIEIGKVSYLEQDMTGLTVSGSITPNVDFRNLQEVLIITTTKQEDIVGE